MAPSAIRLASVAAVLALVAPAHVAATYVLDKTYDASNFLDKFTFNSDDDLTNGFVDYVDAESCDGIVSVSNNKLRLGVDHKTGPKITGRGRKSARLEGTDTFDKGLFIADFAHFPGAACGAWPAFWMYGPSWPHSGEFDMYEAWNLVDYNTVSLHTDGLTECALVPDTSVFSGSVLTSNCDTYYQGQGCGTEETSSSYGTATSPFQSTTGGIYATEWTGDYVKVWSWTHADAPADVLSGSSPDPSGWGTPRSYVGSSGCDTLPTKLTNQHLVLNIAFCGDGAGNNFAQCATEYGYDNSIMGCVNYVEENPSAFEDVYFEVNNIRVFQKASAGYAIAAAATTSSSSSVTSTTSSSTSSTKATTSTTSSSTTSSSTTTTSSRTSTSTSSTSTSSTTVSTSTSARTSTRSSTSPSASTHATTLSGHAAPSGSAPVSVNSTVVPSTTAVASVATTGAFQNYTLSTLYKTTVSTIMSCAPTVTNCPLHHVTTITYAVATTLCPVNGTGSGSGHNGTATGTGMIGFAVSATTARANTSAITTTAPADTAVGYSSAPVILPIAVPTSSVVVASSPASSAPVSTPTPTVVTAGSATAGVSFAAVVGAALCALLL